MNGNYTPAGGIHHALDPWRRTDYVRDMIDAAVFLAINLGVPVPSRITGELEVHGNDMDERIHDVLMTADALGVTAVEDGDGWLCAARQFGPVTLEARTPARPEKEAALWPQDSTTTARPRNCSTSLGAQSAHASSRTG